MVLTLPKLWGSDPQIENPWCTGLAAESCVSPCDLGELQSPQWLHHSPSLPTMQEDHNL